MSKKKQGSGAANVQLYKALRAEGIKKRKAARIAKAIATKLAAPVKATPKRKPKSAPKPEPAVTPTPTEAASDNGYSELTKADLLAEARKVNLRGRATMSKGELLEALHEREHASA